MISDQHFKAMLDLWFCIRPTGYYLKTADNAIQWFYLDSCEHYKLTGSYFSCEKYGEFLAQYSTASSCYAAIH